MRRGVGMHRADHTKVVGETGCMRKEAADRQAALSVFHERERAFHQMPDRPIIGTDRDRAIDVGLAVEAIEGGFGIERVDVRRSSIHEQEDDVLGLGLEVRTINPVAHQRVTDMSQMDPDLVGAPGLQDDLGQARGPEGLERVVVRDRRAPPGHDREPAVS